MNLPTDPLIPVLETMRASGPGPLLEAAGFDSSFEVESLLRHHPGKRCTLSLRKGRTRVVLKAYRDRECIQRLLDLTDGLNKAGLDPQNGPAPAGILASDTEQRYIVSEWFGGLSGRNLIERGEGHRAGELAAMWLNEGRVDLGHFPSISRSEPAARRAADMIASMGTGLPGLTQRASLVLERLDIRNAPAGREVLCHGSLKPGHLFDLGSRPGLIDWESARAGPPELDAGTFLGKLASLRIRHPRLSPALSDARRTFLEATSDVLDPGSVLWYEAFAQLKRAAVASRRRGREAAEKSERLLEEAMTLLSRR